MICITPPHEALIFQNASALCPRSAVNSWDWIRDHGRMPDGTPFDGDIIPWTKGVCDAWDDPATREIALQWGTRLGKTTIAMQLMAKSAATKPMPGLFATSTQSLAERTVRNKIYPVLSAVKDTARLLPHRRWWTTREIRLANALWYVAWSGSDTQLADLSAFYGYGNEIDKWSFAAKQEGEAGEGDPLDQFFERFKEFHNAKIILECSPSTKRRSRIEKRLLQSCNARYWVPCPKCREHQVLRLGKEGEPGGIRFDRLPNGESDAKLARSTARYVCQHCEYEIHDDQRPSMMQKGIWCPMGGYVDRRGRVCGVEERGHRKWGGQLSSLYSLQLRWGDIAEEFIRSKKDRNGMRMFINGWLAETWEPYKSKSEPEQVGQRITVDIPRGTIPEWATWLFAAVDKQQEHYVYGVLAIGPDERAHVVDHGTYDTLEEVETNVIRREFEHADGLGPLSPALTLIDCGYKPKEVYLFCQKFKGSKHLVRPCKGANTDCAGEPYERKVIGLNEGQNTRTKKILIRAGRGLIRIRVNPYYYEPTIQEWIDEKKPGEPGALTLHAECREDIDLLTQICNGAESAEPSKMDPNRHLWVKRWEHLQNDYRDMLKYARCAADVYFKQQWSKAAKRQGGTAKPVRPAAPEPEATRGERARFRPKMERRLGRRGGTE